MNNLYIAVERLNLGDTNWNILINEMKIKGDRRNKQPDKKCHWRPNNDLSVYIFQALFDISEISVNGFINWLANTFGVDPGDISYTSGSNIYGKFDTFIYNSINRFRVGVFGYSGGWPTRNASREACHNFIANNITEWE